MAENWYNDEQLNIKKYILPRFHACKLRNGQH